MATAMEPAPFTSVDATALRWLRTAASPLTFEVSAGDSRLGRLAWARDSGSLATWTTAAGSTTLKRVGFFHPRVTARSANDPRDIARVSVHLNHHRIELTGGPAYRFHRAGLLVPAWQVTTESGTEYLHIEPVRDGRELAGGAVVSPADAWKRPELPLLLALSWYVIVLSWFEDEALVPFEGPDVPASGTGGATTAGSTSPAAP
jgi:hypothetical protein